MHVRDNVWAKLGSAVPFDLKPFRSYTLPCPACADTRSKKNTQSLSVYRQEDGNIWYRCNHTGQCELNKWSKIQDPAPQEVKQEVNAPISMPVPEGVEIPTEYIGDHLFWYKDIEGRALFANRRINLESGAKIYVPFVYTEKGFVSGKGTSWPTNFKGLYGAETIPNKQKVVIVEGEKAADAARKIFTSHAVVSWLGGANRGYDTADWSVLRDIESALLWPDNDDAGRKVMRQIANLLPIADITIANVSHLEKGADLADNISKEDIKLAITTGTKLQTKIDGVFSLDQIKEQLKTVGATRKTGYNLIDAHTPLPHSGLVIIEGRTKHGKSALAVALSSEMLRSGLESKVIFYSYEMTAAKVFMRYLKTADPELTPENYEDSDAYRTFGQFITNNELQIIDQSAQLSIGDIVLAASKPSVRGGIMIIDYLQIVPVASNFGRSSRQLLIKEMLDELRVTAHKNNVLIIVLSQLTPDYHDPRNDSPREAKDIHYSADLVLRIWNKSVGDSFPAYNNITGNYIIHTYLNRDGESNVKYESNLTAGSKITVKRRIKE